VLNPDSLESETPRANELLDTGHWSAWSPHTQTAGTLGPWTAGDHLLYVQVEDDLGSRSFGIVRVRAYDATFDRPLLVVDDTRFEFDRLAPGGCLASYTKSWPSATELDTFLFARGGVPWRCATFQPGAVSPPGLFEGYRADTVSTRLAAEDMASTVTLSLLASYRNVIWLTDQEGALQPGSGSSPLAMLRWMSRPPSARVLEDYVRFGGRAWIAGGGAALASLIETDNGANNTASNTVFSGTELHERSAVVTLAHLRTKILATRVSPLLSRSSAARGGWAGHGMDGMLAAPDYARLPASLSLRTPATDPIPPTRSPSQPSFYYLQSVAMEYAQDAIVHEDFGGPGAPRVESVLDTLIEVVGATIDRAPAPAMFYYHGRENGALLFSGFDLWSWSRADAQALVDFVLGEVWGLPRRSPAPAGLPAVAPRAAGRAAGTRSLDPAPRRP
jgi:hypothetical protein